MRHESTGSDARGRTITGRPVTPGWVQQLTDIARAMQAEPDATKLIEIITTGIVNIPGGARRGHPGRPPRADRQHLHGNRRPRRPGR
jgi:hypothetical protein